MTDLVYILIVFLGIAVFFLFFHMMMGKMIRPARPDTEKLSIYECGEPTIGSAWIQFDVRYYVVALLFVIFDVEVAFFFPWAIVFGSANELSRMPDEQEIAHMPSGPQKDALEKRKQDIIHQLDTHLPPLPGANNPATISPSTAKSWAWLAFGDILVFFGVLMVGFAYLWRRGDIDWVRSTVSEQVSGPGPEPLPPEFKPVGEKQLVGASAAGH